MFKNLNIRGYLVFSFAPSELFFDMIENFRDKN